MKVSMLCIVAFLQVHVALSTSSSPPFELPNHKGVKNNPPKSTLRGSQGDDSDFEQNLAAIENGELVIPGMGADEMALMDSKVKDVVSVLKEVNDFSKNNSMEDQTPDQRADQAVVIGSKMKNVTSLLTDMEQASSGAQEFAMIIQDTREEMKKLEKHVADVIQYIRQEVPGHNKEEQGDTNTHESSTRSRQLVVGLDGSEDRGTPSGSYGGSKSNGKQDPQEQGKRMFAEHMGDQRERVKTMRDGHPRGKVMNMQEAIFNGDHAAARSVADSLYKQHLPKSHSQAAQGHGRRRLSKQDLCENLVTCAAAMSIYDLFVYFNSDDIDATTGEVDENIVKYNEADLLGTHTNITGMAKSMQIAGTFDGDSCNDLLQQFHRTKEFGDVPTWEGATVSQVCLAEGTTTYVKLEDAARTTYHKPSKTHVIDAYHSNDGDLLMQEVKALLKRTVTEFEKLIPMFAFETLQCAEELFVAGMVNYETAPMDDRLCDAGHAVMSREECLVASKELGLFLTNGGMIEGSWTHVPCGCSIVRGGSTHAVHFNSMDCSAIDNDGLGDGGFRQVCQIEQYEAADSSAKLCADGHEIMSYDECLVASNKLGVTLQGDGTLIQGSWQHVPCGCSFHRSNLNAHFNTGDCDDVENDGVGDGTYIQTCKSSPFVKPSPYVPANSNPNEKLCPLGQAIMSEEECMVASNQLGMKIQDDGTLIQGSWYHVPCGCTFHHSNRNAHFNTNDCHNVTNNGLGDSTYIQVCQPLREPFIFGIGGQLPGHDIEKYRFPTLKDDFAVKPHAPDFFVSTVIPAVCPVGLEILTEDMCLFASEQLGIELTDGELIVGNYQHEPCGCVVGVGDNKAHFNTRGCQWGGSSQYRAVCGSYTSSTGDFEIAPDGLCREELAISSREECAAAARDLNSANVIKNHQDALLASSYDLPCGCSLKLEGGGHDMGFVYWNTADCRNIDNGGSGNGFYTGVCNVPKLELESPTARDRYGQIQDQTEDPFNFVSYHLLTRLFHDCAEDLALEMVEKIPDWESSNDFKDSLEEYYDSFLDQCVGAGFFGVIREGIELVFGGRSSPGYVCGVKESVKSRESVIPGTCCFDAPYQREGDDWGLKFDCSSKCLNPGGFLSGMSRESCSSSFGGTWCPNPVDCSALQSCIADYKTQATENSQHSFLAFLNAAPIIGDPTEILECGRTREYFGFDEYFSNDLQVCQDIKQLEFERDFSFLDQFYGQGSAVEDGSEEVEDVVAEEIDDGSTGTAPPIPTLDLKQPDHSASLSPTVQNGVNWRSSNFALTKILKVLEVAIDAADGVPCPEAPVVGTFPCDVVKWVIIVILMALHTYLDVLVDISIFTYGEVAELGNVEPIRMTEQIEVIYDNMELFATYLQDRFGALNDYINDSHQGTQDYVQTSLNSVQNNIAAQFSATNGFLESFKDDVKSDLETVQAMIPVDFDLEIAILSNEDKEFVCVTTQDGKPIIPDFVEISGVTSSPGLETISSFQQASLGTEGLYIKLDGSTNSTVFIVKAGMRDANSYEVTAEKARLVSF